MLEAVIVAAIMLSAIAFIATFETPPEGSTSTRSLLTQDASDALGILYDTPVKNSSLGDNLLSVNLAKCLQGNCTPLTQKISALLPVGSSYALYISNGYDTFPVYVTKSPPGEAITARRLMEPHWSYTFTSAAMSNVNNFSDPALIYSIPVFNSNVVSPGGSPLKVVVEGTRMGDQADYVLQGYYTTEEGGPADVLQEPAVSLNFLVNRTTYQPYGTTLDGGQNGYYPGAFWDRYHEVMDTQSGFPNNASVPFSVELKETAGVPVPAGTEIRVDIPRGWNASGWNNDSWQVLQNATDWNASSSGSQVVARLLKPVASGAVDFSFNGTYHGDMLKYYTFHAVLSKGASAEANVVVVADGYGDSSQTFVVPSVKMSVPRPMGVSAPTTWSLVVNIPYTPNKGVSPNKDSIRGFDTSKPKVSPYVSTDPAHPNAGVTTDVAAGYAIDIQKITITEQDGVPIFGSTVTPGKLDEPGGTWTSYGSFLEWTGHHSSFDGPLNLTFDVNANAHAGVQTARANIVPPVTFSPWQGRLIDQISPGLYRDAFLPNNTTGQNYAVPLRGYAPDTVNLSTPLTHPYSSNPVYRSQLLQGRSNYSINQLSPIHDSIFGSYVNVDKRTVPIGGKVVFTTDVQSILYALSEAGEAAGVNLTLYPPWTGDSHVPIWSVDNLDSSVVASDYSAMTMLDINGDGYPDPVMATTQGRVFALDAVTGARLQGNEFVAPWYSQQTGTMIDPVVNPVVQGASPTRAAYSGITAMGVAHLYGQDYIVAGGDQASGVYLLDKSLKPVYYWNKTLVASSKAVLIDTATDYDGDGQHDISITLDDSTVWLLHAYSAASPPPSGSWHVLSPIAPSTTTTPFYTSAGSPSAFASTSSIGPAKKPGFVVSLLNQPGPASKVTVGQPSPTDPQVPNPPQMWVNAPRAGLNAVDTTGQTMWTFGAGPIQSARDYGDYNGDGIHDIVAGSTAGFVTMLNGQKGMAPMSGVAFTPSVQAVDGKTPTAQDAAFVTQDGSVYFTHDRWVTTYCVNCDPSSDASHVDARLDSITLNSTGSMWMAGLAGTLYRTDTVHGSHVAVPVVPTITKAGNPLDITLAPYDFHDVYFRWGPHWTADKSIRDEGWLVAGPATVCGLHAPLDTTCSESGVLHTTDGGLTWTAFTHGDSSLQNADGTMVTAVLTRINFTTPQLGWIVGHGGTILRSMPASQNANAGLAWTGIPAPLATTADITDISCVPGQTTVTCIASGAGGYLWKTTDATSTAPGGPVWTNISAGLGSFAGQRTVHSVAMVSATIGYAGADNAMLGTWNGGQSWSALPMGYVPANIARVNVLPDGTGYGWGGNASATVMFIFGGYLGNATYQTTDITQPGSRDDSGNVWDASYTVWGVNVTTSTSTSQPGKLYWHVSADNGADWTTPVTGVAPATNGVTPVSIPDPSGGALDLPASWYEAYVADPAHRGRDVLVNVTFNTTPDGGFTTPQIHSIQLAVEYRVASDGYSVNHTWTKTIDLSQDARIDAQHTTAAWDPGLGVLYAPLATKFWSTNVSGAVYDVHADYDINHDGYKDVWASTGGVISMSSPDYNLYAGTDENKYLYPDDRVYLIDGKTGAILHQTSSLPYNVTQIRLADENGDGIPDVLYALSDDPGAPSFQISAFDPVTLAPLDSPISPGHPWATTVWSQNAIGMELSAAPNVGSQAIVPMTSVATTGGSVPSNVIAVPRTTAQAQWHYFTDTRGIYVIQKDIPTGWFFGPYIAEITVNWQDRVTGVDAITGHSEVYSVLQSARFYDYFMVTPPSALAPASPLYDVQLVAWFDDWR